MRWIEATHLETWGRSTISETELPALVADLICATADGITSIRFPSRGKGRVRGFDGVLESSEGSLFVPNGKSVWEFKSSASYKSQANSDFEKRTRETSLEDQKELTLVLVTPFTWDSSENAASLENWVNERKKRSSWRDIKLIEGTHLEHWLALAPAVSARWARGSIRGFSVSGVQSVEEYWRHFSARFDPRIIEELLTAERESNVEELLRVLMGTPQQISIVGDAPEFVIAFAVAAIRSAQDETREYLNARTLIVDTIEAGRELAGQKNLAFLLRREAAQSPSSFADDGPTLVPLVRHHRSASASALPRQTWSATKQVLLKMNVPDGRAETLARGCGGSLSALGRMMPSGDYPLPAWTADLSLLLPAFLAGAWDSSNPHDQEIVAALAGTANYVAYESQIRRFLNIEDAPLVREENIYKVTAPIDAFVRAGALIGEEHLDSLQPLLGRIFGYIDPDPDPHEPFRKLGSDRHSDWLRDGLATTLLLIAAWQKEADLAEAAPRPFLEALERMLEGSGAAIRPIFDEVAGFAFPTSKHTGVVWALETLAWDPAWFRRSCLILAKLAAIDPGGRIGNRPGSSLCDILLPWLPCTYASADERLAIVDEIAGDEPDVGWNLVLRLLPGQTTASSGTSRPTLRGAEFPPQPALTNGDVWMAQRELSRRAVALAVGDSERMRQLLGPMLQFGAEERAVGLNALDATLADSFGDDRERLWESLQDQVVRHQRYRSAQWAMDAGAVAELATIADRYRPDDPILIASEAFGFWFDDEERMLSERVNIIRELGDKHGPDAVRALVRRSRQPHLALGAIGNAGFAQSFLEEMVRCEFAEAPDDWNAGSYFSLLRKAAGIPSALSVASDLLRSGNASGIARLVRSWPTEPDTWNAAAMLGEEVLEYYWSEFTPHRIEGSRRHLLTVLVQLMRRGRSIAALETTFNRLNEVPSCLLLRILDTIVGELNTGARPTIANLLDYEIEEAFKSLDMRGLPDMAIGQREYALLPLLERENRPLKLHSLMASDPGMFHQIVRDVYRAESEPPSDEEEKDSEDRARWRQAYQLLSHFSTVPGFNGEAPDEPALQTWVAEVRRLGVEYDREEITDIVIGNLLAHAPVDDLDQVWPHRFVRSLLEEKRSKLSRGMLTERVNMRGVTVRGVLDGGQLERDLAAALRRDAKAIGPWPKTAAMLRALADRWDAHAQWHDVDARQRRLKT